MNNILDTDQTGGAQTGEIWLGALLQRVAAGEQEALQRLYQSEGARLYGIALRLTGDSSLASEAVLALLVQLWRGMIRFAPPDGTPEGWLVAALRSRAIDLLRRHQRDGAGTDATSRAIDADADIARLRDSPDPAARRLHEAMAGLERDGRHLLVMAYLDGLSHAEIALRTRLPVGTVKSSTHRSLELLRAGLEAGR